MYLWFKLLHVFFVISWFAGLFYLPRIYVNLAQLEPGSVEYIRLTDMSRRLYRFMSPLGWGTLIFGAAIGFVNIGGATAGWRLNYCAACCSWLTSFIAVCCCAVFKTAAMCIRTAGIGYSTNSLY